MSAIEVTDKVVEAINSGKYDSIILNYANCDMAVSYTHLDVYKRQSLFLYYLVTSDFGNKK